MYHFNTPNFYHQAPGPAASTSSQLQSRDIILTLRQQPKEALITTEGKEKARKPVDPPPIIQLEVKPQADPAQHFLQSPYLFMCTSLFKAEKNEAWDANANKSLAGSLVSSLHRLKDIDNKDGGFFVFGDISVKIQGTFRLHFSLFDLQKDSNEVLFLGSITSEPFKVLLPKDFKGMEESTYLSRAFSDQGVRLRLRKEPRAMMSNKRPNPYAVDPPVSEMMRNSAYSYDDGPMPSKRFRSDNGHDHIKRDPYPDHTTAAFSIPPTLAPSQFPLRHSGLLGVHTTTPFQNPREVFTTESQYDPFRTPGMENPSSYMSSDPHGPHSYTRFMPSYSSPTTSTIESVNKFRPAPAPTVLPLMNSTALATDSSLQSHDSLQQPSSRGAPGRDSSWYPYNHDGKPDGRTIPI